VKTNKPAVDLAIASAAAAANRQPLDLTVERDRRTLEFAIDPSPSLPLHPTQLYMSTGAFALFLLLSAYYPFRRRDGEVVAMFAVSYSVGRFLVEYLRFDELPLADGLTISQNVSVAFIVVGLGLLLLVKRRPIVAAAQAG
jgi:prolipoprotein diacylglyceryltransferase